ncbi:uroporphyrinogen-III C-methyltransferase [Leptolyngbya ohadii]|uniref:uroporphyrinogen-III C-methyltransferase n=1 Tax=Leptolyngbya ohadii TaxID=1962290 RepID=UPI0021F1AC9C|nr:uroporphyrinogen-III C-methyltransferase [Leptolyngbya ohadii]
MEINSEGLSPQRNSLGKVYLVGSGVGTIDLLTVKAYRLIGQAEAIVYDALVDQAILDLASANCEIINVGKRGGQPSTPQAAIDRLLVNLCRQGKRVIRLKSGDPFIFGRSLSEIQALIEANCPFEVIPGISSALAAPLLADIPLTDPVLSRGFAVVTAHEPDALNWQGLAQMDTLVILMGTKQLPVMIEELIRHGRASTTPIAIIRWAGQPDQQIWTGTLETIIRQVGYSSGGSASHRQPLSPAVIVIGEVVRLRPYLQSPLNRQNSFDS